MTHFQIGTFSMQRRIYVDEHSSKHMIFIIYNFYVDEIENLNLNAHICVRVYMFKLHCKATSLYVNMQQ